MIALGFVMDVSLCHGVHRRPISVITPNHNCLKLSGKGGFNSTHPQKVKRLPLPSLAEDSKVIHHIACVRVLTCSAHCCKLRWWLCRKNAINGVHSQHNSTCQHFYKLWNSSEALLSCHLNISLRRFKPPSIGCFLVSDLAPFGSSLTSVQQKALCPPHFSTFFPGHTNPRFVPTTTSTTTCFIQVAFGVFNSKFHICFPYHWNADHFELPMTCSLLQGLLPHSIPYRRRLPSVVARKVASKHPCTNCTLCRLKTRGHSWPTFIQYKLQNHARIFIGSFLCLSSPCFVLVNCPQYMHYTCLDMEIGHRTYAIRWKRGTDDSRRIYALEPWSPGENRFFRYNRSHVTLQISVRFKLFIVHLGVLVKTVTVRPFLYRL